MRIGIDIGGVIIDRVKDGVYDASFKVDDLLNTPAVAGAFESIRELVALFGSENVYLVSVCDHDTEMKTNEWLKAKNFFPATGMLNGNVRNCLERPQKTVIARQLGLTHFIDDRPDVLDYMVGTVPFLYLFSAPGNQQASSSDYLIVVEDWDEILSKIRSSLSSVKS